MQVWRLLPAVIAALALAGCNDDVAVSACSSPDVRVPQVNLGLDGPGFFIVEDGSGALAYAPAGGFCADPNGLLIDGSGNRLQAYAATVGGGFNQGQLLDVVLPLQSAGGVPFADYAVDPAGVLEAIYADDSRDVLGKLAVATFPSPQNLIAAAGDVCRETLESGVAGRGEPGEPGFGVVVPGLPPPFTCDQGRVDLGVSGPGYFVLDTGSTSFYDDGIVLGTDAQSRYVDGRGFGVTGYAVDEQGATVPVLSNLVAPAPVLPPEATTEVAIAVTLSGSSTPIALAFDANNPATWNFATDVSIFDPVGIARVARFHFSRGANGSWSMNTTIDGLVAAPPTNIMFALGEVVSPSLPVVDLGPFDPGSGVPVVLRIDLAGLLLASGPSADLGSTRDGTGEGRLVATHILPNGELRADYSNGVTGVLVGQLALARDRRPGAAVDVPGADGLGSVTSTPHASN